MVISLTEQLAGKIKSRDKVTKQLAKRLKQVATPDLTKEIPIEEKIKELDKKFKKRRRRNDPDDTADRENTATSFHFTSQYDETTFRTTNRTMNFKT